MINGRAATFQVDGGEDLTLDHYAAARNTYLSRRQQ
jgi:ABC-type transporter lipoprotein component MlaA